MSDWDSGGNPRRNFDNSHEAHLHHNPKNKHVYISFEDGLQNILHVPSGWKSVDHEYQRIISRIREDPGYLSLWEKYISIYDTQDVAIEECKNRQAELYNYAISLVNHLCNRTHKKPADDVLSFRTNQPMDLTMRFFYGLSLVIRGVLSRATPGMRDPQIWPTVIHVGETDGALDMGQGTSRAINLGERDTIYEDRECTPTKHEQTSETNITLPAKRKRSDGDAPLATHKKDSDTSQQPSSPGNSSTSQQLSILEVAAGVLTDAKALRKMARIRERCIHYLTKILELSILRSHAFLVLADCYKLQIMYADHSAIVTTGIIDLTTADREAMFLAMLVALHRLTPKQWGFLLEPAGDIADSTIKARDCLKDFTMILTKDHKALELKLEDLIHYQIGIIGRGTCVVGVKCQKMEEWQAIDLVVKVSWPEATRESEISLLERARITGVELVEKRKRERAALETEVMKLRRNGKADEAALKLKYAEELIEESEQHWALNHLPNILHSEDINLASDEEPMPQTKLAIFFSHAEFNNGHFVYVRHTLRVSVQERLHELSNLLSVPSYAQVFYDVMTCHRWLYDFPRILHRDISPGNIMYRICKGQLYGVLNDFDLSSLRAHLDLETPSSLEPTGTPPYMAIDLLSNGHHNKLKPPIRHLYRHDLESLTYVILLLCSRYKFEPGSGREPLTQPHFDIWLDHTVSSHTLACAKSSCVTRPVVNRIHPSFSDFNPWLRTLMSAFRHGFVARADWECERDMREHGEFSKRRESTQVSSNEGVAAGIHPSNETMPELDAENIAKLPPFDDETLGGKVDYISVARSLRTFGGVRLENRSKDDGAPPMVVP